MSGIFEAKTSVIARKELAENTMEVSFKRPANFEFTAGQYAQIIIPKLLFPDTKGGSRLFSIASSPNDKERVTIAFRDSGSGYKHTLIASPLGHEIVIKGPFGVNFTLPKEASRNVVFIAGGIGITPFLSMSRFAVEERLPLSITVLYANRNEKSAAYRQELEDIAKSNLNFIVKNKFGMVDEQFLTQNIKDISRAEWYVAGPPPMVEAVLNILSILKVDSANLHKEKFTGY